MKLAINVLLLTSAMWVGTANADETILNNTANDNQVSSNESLNESFLHRRGGHHHRHHRRRHFHPRPTATTCFAQNARGIVFRVSGWSSTWSLQNDAVRYCRSNSYFPNTCRPIGCR